MPNVFLCIWYFFDQISAWVFLIHVRDNVTLEIIALFFPVLSPERAPVFSVIHADSVTQLAKVFWNGERRYFSSGIVFKWWRRLTWSVDET